MDRVKRIWYLSPMRAAKVQASMRIRAVSPEPPLLAHTSSESRGTFRQKARSLAPLNGWACAVKICYDGMLEDTNSLDGAHISLSEFMIVLMMMSMFCYRSDLAYFDGINETILAAALVKPKTGMCTCTQYIHILTDWDMYTSSSVYWAFVINGPCREKTCHMRTAKAQISLSILRVW